MSAQTNCSSNSDKGTYTAEIGIGILIIFITFAMTAVVNKKRLAEQLCLDSKRSQIGSKATHLSWILKTIPQNMPPKDTVKITSCLTTPSSPTITPTIIAAIRGIELEPSEQSCDLNEYLQPPKFNSNSYSKSSPSLSIKPCASNFAGLT